MTLRPALATAVMLLNTQQALAATLLINNGLAPPNSANVIDFEVPADTEFYVADQGCGIAPGCFGTQATEVELVDGGSFNIVELFGRSSLTLSGGSFNDAILADESTATMINGSGGGLYSVGTVSIQGGSVASVQGDFVSVSGGTVIGSLNGVSVLISGGFVGGVYAGSAIITGGTIGTLYSSGDFEVYSGEIGGFGVGNGSLDFFGGQLPDTFYVNAPRTAPGVTFHGGDFTLNGLPIDFGVVTECDGILAGRLSSGERFSMDFEQCEPVGGNTGNLVTVAQAPVPEPSTAALAGCILLGVGLSRGRRWRIPLA